MTGFEKLGVGMLLLPSVGMLSDGILRKKPLKLNQLVVAALTGAKAGAVAALRSIGVNLIAAGVIPVSADELIGFAF